MIEAPAVGITFPGGGTNLRATVSGDSLLFETLVSGTPSTIATYDLTAKATDTLGELAARMQADNPIGALFAVLAPFGSGDLSTLLVDQVRVWSTFSLDPLVAVES